MLVLRGDADAIRLIGSDPRATDQTLPLMFFAVLAATVRVAVVDPVDWAVRSFLVASFGLLAYAAALWLIGKAFEGTGRFIALFRVAGFTAVPLALGLVPGIGLAVGAVWSFLLAARVLWALHVQETQVAVVTAVLPSMLIVAIVFALTAQAIS
ncbi:MAG: YIP1 family protein [Acidimicrobiia bacterium]|nr:YIP1 family protein [Acidimicrobiia bacterium]